MRMSKSSVKNKNTSSHIFSTTFDFSVIIYITKYIIIIKLYINT